MYLNYPSNFIGDWYGHQTFTWSYSCCVVLSWNPTGPSPFWMMSGWTKCVLQTHSWWQLYGRHHRRTMKLCPRRVNKLSKHQLTPPYTLNRVESQNKEKLINFCSDAWVLTRAEASNETKTGLSIRVEYSQTNFAPMSWGMSEHTLAFPIHSIGWKERMINEFCSDLWVWTIAMVSKWNQIKGAAMVEALPVANMRE